MNKDTVEQIYSELSPTEDSFERSKIFELLRTRVAGGLEMDHKSKKAEKYWDDISRDLEDITNANPTDAFRFAIETLELIQPAEDPEQYRTWLKGNALIILSHPKVRSFVLADLNKQEESVLYSSFNEFLDYQVPQSIQTEDDLSDHPQCFNLVMSLVIIHSLQEQKAQSIFHLEQRSQDLLKDELIKQVIGLYYDVSGDKELVEPLYQDIQTSSIG